MAASPSNSGDIQMAKMYRPYLRTEELEYLSLLLSSVPPLEPALGKLHKQAHDKMKLAHFKATEGLVQPSHVKTKVPLAERLEIQEELDSLEDTGYDSKRAALYAKWLESPDSLDAAQLKQVHTYRYTENLMTPEEEEEYEKVLTT